MTTSTTLIPHVFCIRLKASVNSAKSQPVAGNRVERFLAALLRSLGTWSA